MMHAAARTIAVMAALGAITSCRPAADTQPEIVIGVSPFQDTIMPMVAQEKGWYREAGLKVRFVIRGERGAVRAGFVGGPGRDKTTSAGSYPPISATRKSSTTTASIPSTTASL